MRKVFYFFHQTRLTKSLHYAFGNNEPDTQAYAVDVIENYKDWSKTIFLVDPICSKLFYILYSNYGESYNTFLKPKYLGIIDTMLRDLILCYKGMRSNRDIDKIVDVLFPNVK